MKKTIISGKELRSKLTTIPDRRAEYRMWLKHSDLNRLFGTDADWLVEHLTEGEGPLENCFLIFYENLGHGLQKHLRTFLEEKHTLDSLKKENLGYLRTLLSTFVSGDLSAENETNAIIDDSIYEIITYKNHEITERTLNIRKQKEQEQRCLPFQLLENTTNAQIRSFSTAIRSKVDEAKSVGIKRILSTLPPSPGDDYYWSQHRQDWIYKYSSGTYRFKGVDDSDYD